MNKTTDIQYVEMKDIKELVQKQIIQIDHISDDGEFMRFKVLPDGPTYGMWIPSGPLQVVDGETIHRSMVAMHPQLFKESYDETK